MSNIRITGFEVENGFPSPLHRCFSQNIDSLETQAGLPPDKLVAAHGNFDSARCIENGKAVPIE